MCIRDRRGWEDGESIANDVCVPIRREAVSSAHMLERCVLLMFMVPGIIYPGTCSGENSESRMNGGQEAITLAAAVVKADVQE